MKRDDIEMAQTDIDTAGKDRCPVNNSIKPGIPIQGAVDNFNHKERTDSGGDVSNDTVLVIWQNGKEDDIEPRRMSKRDNTKYAVDRKRSLQHTLPCQQLMTSQLAKNSGEISEEFSPITHHIHKNSILTEVNDDFFAWFVSRLKGTNDIPNFTALLSKLKSREVRMMTARSFIPILPYPATLMDSIYTSMMNFKDVLHQRGESSGALWCDEGVYCLAKDIQLLKPELFGSIFLGLGPFHWSKIIMGAIGKWLNPSGIGEALKKSGVFAADVALSSVLKGGDYMKAKDGINMIAESILRLQYEAFLESDEFYSM